MKIKQVNLRKKQFRPLVFACFVLAVATLATGCTTLPANSVKNQAPPGSSSHTAAPQNSNTSTELSLNLDLLALIGAENSTIKQAYSGICAGYITGMGAACLTYYEPYINFLFCQTTEPDIWQNADPFLSTHAENPFVDGLTVMQIVLHAQLNASGDAVASQDSLKQLFTVDAPITYALLCEALQQQPEFKHHEMVTYTAPTSFESEMETAPVPIQGGLYDAIFMVDDTPVTISFVKNGDDYTALTVAIGTLIF